MTDIFKLIEDNRTFYFKVVLRVTRNFEDAQDIFQNVCFGIFKDSKRGKFKNINNLRAYIRQIFLFRALALKRQQLNWSKNFGKTSINIENIPSSVNQENDKEFLEENLVLSRNLHRAISELPKNQRRVMEIALIKPEISEIAKVLNKKYNTTKSNYRWGLEKLKEKLNAP